MTAHPITVETLAGAFDRRAKLGGRGPAWLEEMRRAAMARVAARGLPGPRDEDWKYSSLAPLLAMPFDLGVDGRGGAPAAAALAGFTFGTPSAPRLVFVNGRYVAKLSAVGPLPGGVRVGSLAAALDTDTETLRRHLSGFAGEDADPFAALNTAFWEDGVFVSVPAGVTLTQPVHALFLATAPEGPRVGHPRSLVVLGADSRAAVVESYAALDRDVYLTDAVTEALVGPGAALDHVKITVESSGAFHVGRLEARQERDSRVRACAVALGGRMVRNVVRVELDGEGVDCRLSGLSVLAGQQHLDTHTIVDHRRPRGTSRQIFKGVLDGRSRGAFSGRVVVHRGAVGTDAHQINKNLLLADGVEADSKPQLEIFADDVKCSHGAADGELAEDAIFYLRSRGLDEAAARTLLTQGFAREVLEQIRMEAVREWCEARLAGRLRAGRVAEEGT